MSPSTTCFIILALVVALFVWNRLPIGVVAIGAALALLLLVSSANGGIVALALLAGFTAFLVARRGSGVGCGCFGSTKTEPISWRDIGRNVVLMALAAIAAFA